MHAAAKLIQPSENEPAHSSIQDRVAALRELLHRKYPTPELRETGILPTSFEAFDGSQGGLKQGAVTEVVGPTSSGSLFIEIMLRVLGREQAFGALFQAGASFHPQDVSSAALRRLLWVRCSQPLAAVKAVDLLLRDGNLRVLLLDLQFAPQRELQRIPASTWHRFQRLIEASGMVFVILSSRPMIEGAKTRIVIRQRWSLGAMRQRRRGLMQTLAPQVFDRRDFAALLADEKRSA